MLETYSLTKDTLVVSSESNIKNSSVVYVYGDERNISNFLNINMTLK